MEDLVNHNTPDRYDVILLDRDCKLGGSFHVLDIEKFGADKVISISSTPTWNEEARARGVKRIIPKSFSDLNGFARDVVSEIMGMFEKKR